MKFMLVMIHGSIEGFAYCRAGSGSGVETLNPAEMMSHAGGHVPALSRS